MQKNNPYNSKINNFFIFGYFGWNNAGDDAIGYSILKTLFSLNHDAKFIITANGSYFSHYTVCFCPDVTIKFIDFEFFSILQALYQSDFFIIAGGTHFHDEDQFLLRRLFLFTKFYVLILFSKMTGKQPILLGHGIGPVSKWWSIFFLKRILANSQAIFVRDADSQLVVGKLGVSKKCFLGFDCSAMLFPMSGEREPTNRKIVGISLLPAYSIYSRTPSRDTDLVSCIAQTINELLQKEPGLIIRLFAFRTGTLHSDTLFLMDLKEKITPNNNEVEVIGYEGDIHQFIQKIDYCDYFIGMRYHSSLFAYLLHKPQIVIDYMGKCRSLVHEIELPNEALISLEYSDGEHFSKKAIRLLRSPEKFLAKYSPDDAIKRTRYMFETVNQIFLEKRVD